jgi:hypothetical protein
MFYKASLATVFSSLVTLYVCCINIKTFIMKKKRSIQKLKVHKETISNLNTITGGDLTTSAVRGTRVIQSVVLGTCDCPSTAVVLCSSYDDYKC